ncbi:MAG TPA: glycosyltransferase family 4 protein [Pyrinomonadaceae bacterium]|nr:glycosyltransferase family 4 protein [Pyrinomonadaceae bacterium]
MSRIAILTSHLAPGDAVSNDVIGMSDALQRRGYESRIYAGSWDITEPQVYPVEEITQFLRDPQDLLIYHHSIAWVPGQELLRDLNSRKAIKYHNVTPPEFFIGISPWHEEKCREGRGELTDVAGAGCEIYLADSEFNCQDLIDAGAPTAKCFVVPPFHHVERLEGLDADLDVLDKYRDGKTNILMVSRIAPHKGHEALIEAFAAYHLDYNRESRLIIVGKEEEPFKIYSQRLRELASFMLIDGAVVFTGGVTDQELRAYYLLANLFAIASEHEGFCVPIIEAMAMKVPIVAYGSSAIPATLADAGILINQRSPYLMAEAMHRLASDEELNVAFGIRGRQRYDQHFTEQKIEAALFNSVSSLESK